MKNLFLFLLSFVILYSCSNAQNKGGDATSSTGAPAMPADSASYLGDSPDGRFRAFKSQEPGGTGLNLVNLSDLKTYRIGVTKEEKPKFYWSSGKRFLIAENATPDSTQKAEVFIYDLYKMEVWRRYAGRLITYDLLHDVIFFYTEENTRQSINFVYVNNPDYVSPREVIAVPIGKLPSMIVMSKDRQARVKAYTTDDTPVNFIIHF
ncbi:MAG TPA: hypothetical protein DCF33_06340 [Saprospirales bacterium]|nr:hypothetical protein [Saprospirales bacterium]